jgi:predicted DNA-binding transcriptional regulator YafY
MNGMLKRTLETGQILEMIYMSDKGEISQRKIRVITLTPGTVRAYCFMRKQQRSFKISNILSIGPIREINKGA